MTTADLIHLLTELEDTHELVLTRSVPGDPLLAAWRIAAADARDAYAQWCDRPGPLTHSAYLAAADQADAASAALCASVATSPCGCPHGPLLLAA